MAARWRLTLPGMLAVSVLLSGCAILGPIFGFPPMGGVELVIENTTDEDWVVRVFSDGFAQDIAVRDAETGRAVLAVGAPTSVALLDPECHELDALQLSDPPMAVRIEEGGQLTEIAHPREGAVFNEYFECQTGFGPAPSAGEPVSGATGTIHFLSGEAKGWRVDAATAELLSLNPTGLSLDTEQSVSPDGTMIVFTRYAEGLDSSALFVSGADGGDERMLVDEATEPAWSPDGTHVAFLRFDPFSGGPTVNVVGLDGGEARELAESAGAYRWSPDGRQIAFMTVDAGDLSQPSLPPSELQVVNVDGTGLRTLAVGQPFADEPAWSPDGSRIAFSGGTDTVGTIEVVDVASGEVSTIAEVDGAVLGEVAWSPDGRRIAFVITSVSPLRSDGAVGIVPANGGEVERAGELPQTYFASPTWSPDGEWLSVVRTTGMDLTSDLVVIHLASGEETVLATGVLTVLSWRD